MPRKKDLVTIKLEEIKVKPELVYKADIVKSGNSCSIKAPKEFFGRRALVIILDEENKSSKK